MLILSNDHVALSNLRVKGHLSEYHNIIIVPTGSEEYWGWDYTSLLSRYENFCIIIAQT